MRMVALHTDSTGSWLAEPALLAKAEHGKELVSGAEE